MNATTTHPIAAITTARTATAARKAAKAAGLTQKRATQLWIVADTKRHQREIARLRLPAADVPVVDRWLDEQITAAYHACNFRQAYHCHEWSYDTREIEGDAGTECHTDRVWPDSVGVKLPGSYKYMITTSSHHLRLGPRWLANVRARGLAVLEGLLTLHCDAEPDLRARADGRAYRAAWARQGRGTMLSPRSGWLVRDPRGGWVHASSVREARRVGGSVPQATSYDGDFADCLDLDPRVTFRDARAAGLCATGIRDWTERHNGGSNRPTRASVLWQAAQASGDRVALVERAIRQAMGRVLAAGRAAA